MIPAAHDAPSQASSRRVLPPRLRFRSARWIEQRSVDNGSTYAIARTFEAQCEVLTAIETVWGSPVRARFDYVTNAHGQRTSALKSVDAFADTMRAKSK